MTQGGKTTIHPVTFLSAATGSCPFPTIMMCYRPPLCVVLVLLILEFAFIGGVCAANADSDVTDATTIARIVLAALLLVNPELLGTGEPPRKKMRVGTTIRRRRRSVPSIMNELGGSYIPRAYRMKRQSFWRLFNMLYPFLRNKRDPLRYSKKKARNGARNGIIDPPVRLSMAIRYFAGGSPVDIAIVHGVSPSEVYRAVWEVVDAVNACKTLQFEFPSKHAEQMQLASDFERLSRAGFDNCAGAIDGILVWIHKPTDEDCGDIGAGKFFCGRKKKFGINMQAVCDAQRRFLDVDIRNPGSMSDYLVFMRSDLKHKLETPGYLAAGLALYGDNAYVNTPYMASPFKGVSDGPQDTFNYFHSGLRIHIECAFGMLVHRWGILRKPIPMGITIEKTCALVYCLCKLHNFCINVKEGKAQDNTAADLLDIASHGGVPLDADGNPAQLMNAGHHFDDVNRNVRRQFERSQPEELPRDRLLEIVVNQDLRRPKL